MPDEIKDHLPYSPSPDDLVDPPRRDPFPQPLDPSDIKPKTIEEMAEELRPKLASNVPQQGPLRYQNMMQSVAGEIRKASDKQKPKP